MVKYIHSIQNILIQIEGILNKKQKKETIFVFFCMLVGSSLELLGVSAIYPFLQMMLNYEMIQEEWYVRWVYDIFPHLEMKGVLLFIGGFIILIYILKNFFLLFSTYIQNRYASRIQCEISTTMLDEYLKRPYQFFLNTNSGILMRGITTDIEGVYQIFLHFFTVVAELLTVMVLGIYLFITDWELALGITVLMIACFMLIILGLKNKIKKAGRNRHNAMALKNQYGYQAINGIKEIMVLDRRENFVRQYYKAAALSEKAEIVKGVSMSCPDRILEGVCISGFMGIVCIKIAIGTDLGTFIPVLGAFAMGAFKILPSLSKIASRGNLIIYYQPSLKSVYDNIQEVKEYEKQKIETDVLKSEYEENIQFKKELVLSNIKWKYQSAKDSVLHHVSLCIHKGEAVAFIGTSGAGKTTLADIIMGLLEPQEGKVEMDGIDIFSIPHQWAKIIGYVPQSVFLIDDTIRRNVAFGLENNVISDEKIWAALKQAQLKEFVEELPLGLDTIVGERGIKLSGGQRQRIAIARALYEDPDILVLDEATSSLDNETENAVIESIDALQGMKTLIIVAHRLTTIRNCDRIYEIGNGIAVERNKDDVLGKI